MGSLAEPVRRIVFLLHTVAVTAAVARSETNCAPAGAGTSVTLSSAPACISIRRCQVAPSSNEASTDTDFGRAGVPGLGCERTLSFVIPAPTRPLIVGGRVEPQHRQWQPRPSGPLIPRRAGERARRCASAVDDGCRPGIKRYGSLRLRENRRYIPGGAGRELGPSDQPTVVHEVRIGAVVLRCLVGVLTQYGSDDLTGRCVFELLLVDQCDQRIDRRLVTPAGGGRLQRGVRKQVDLLRIG